MGVTSPSESETSGTSGNCAANRCSVSDVSMSSDVTAHGKVHDDSLSTLGITRESLQLRLVLRGKSSSRRWSAVSIAIDSGLGGSGAIRTVLLVPVGTDCVCSTLLGLPDTSAEAIDGAAAELGATEGRAVVEVTGTIDTGEGSDFAGVRFIRTRGCST